MNIVSPTHEGLAQSTKYMLWWLRMYSTACSIAVQIMPYARVRQLVMLEIITKPMEAGDSFTVFQRTAPLQMQQLMGSMTDICRDAAIANESVRVLFSFQGRHLKPMLYVATKLKPTSHDSSSEVRMDWGQALRLGILSLDQIVDV